MTKIQRITARGFKSFAKRTELIFGDKFNIIIGANGVGKSNVADALCFVLGKSSAKEMRAEKSSNLIYNGGKKNPPAKEAEVIIEFDNSNKIFPLTDDLVKITRLVRHSGQSIYKINDEVRTKQQVLDLLNAAKINPDGHNIILQGDIVNLMEMRPVERRKIIEDISGISVFEEKKIKCINELEKVDEKLKEAEIILTEREANLRELKKERDQAMYYKEIKENITDHKATYAHLQINQKNEKIAELEKRIKEQQSEIEKIQILIDEDKLKISSWKNEIKNINQEIEDKGEKEQIILRKEIEDLRTNIVKATSRLDVCKSEIKKIEARKLQLNNNVKELNDKIKELNNNKQKFTQEKLNFEKEHSSIENKIKSVREKYGFADLNDYDKIDKEIESLISAVISTQEKKQSLLTKKEQISFQIVSIDDKIKGIRGSKEEIEEYNNKKQKLKEASSNFDKLLDKDASLESQLSKTRLDLFKKTEELSLLNARQQGILERSFSDNAVRKIINLKDKIGGIYGTVSDLGKVKSKYSLALEVAAGARIQSIVVDTDLTASKCIQELKQSKLGIATFLPLNKIKPRANPSNLNLLLNKKGVEGLALNLIDYDKKFENVFSYVFGSTLIVDSLETARSIGVGNVRMVTLEGDLLDVSGAMIGGYRQKQRIGGFKEEELLINVKNLEKEIPSLKNLIKKIEEDKSAVEKEIISLRDLKNNLEGDIIRLEKSLNLKVDISILSKEQNSLKQDLAKIEKEISDLNAKTNSNNKQMEKLKENKLKARKNFNDAKLINELNDLEAKRTSLIGNIAKLNSEISSINTQIEAILSPEITRTEKILKDHEKETIDFSKESSELAELIKARSLELKQKEQQEKQSYGKFKNLAITRNKLNDKMQNRETSLIRNEERVRTFEGKINNILVDKAKFVAEKEGLDKEFEQYKDGAIKRGMSLDELKDKIREYEKALEKMGNVNLRALEVYEEIAKEHKSLVEKADKLNLEKQDVVNMMKEIETNKKDTFMKTYNTLNKNFRQIFFNLYQKGEAHFELEDPENIFEAGLDIKVNIAKNKFLDIRSLSGGEKTLAALAFIFAIQEYQPSSFYFLDEVDAALDKKNSEILSRLIAKYAEKAQYIVISHNDNIITEADQVYGVSMQEGISKVVSLKI